jgi:hypothetical protein
MAKDGASMLEPRKPTIQRLGNRAGLDNCAPKALAYGVASDAVGKGTSDSTCLGDDSADTPEAKIHFMRNLWALGSRQTLGRSFLACAPATPLMRTCIIHPTTGKLITVKID